MGPGKPFVLLLLLASGTQAALQPPPTTPSIVPPKALPIVPLDQQTQAELNRQGLMLATQFLMLTEAAGKTGSNSTFLRPLMSPAYQIVRADGSRETPDTYTAPTIDSYKVSDAIATAPDPNVLVVRYYVSANETLHGRQLNTSRRPRMTVFARSEAGGGGPEDTSWRLVSHAGFNEPTELECDRGDSNPGAPPEGPAAELGMAVMQGWIYSVANGLGLNASNYNIQVQFANGSGFATKKELAPIKPMAIESVTHLKATRAGRLLVLSYNAITKVAKYGRPHLTVFLEDGGPLAGNWSMIAQSNFNSPKLPPTDPQCAGVLRSAAAAPRGGGAPLWVLCTAAALALAWVPVFP